MLCAPSLEDVIVTIRSRCRHLALRTPSVAAVADLLVRRDGIDPPMAAFAARAARATSAWPGVWPATRAPGSGGAMS